MNTVYMGPGRATHASVLYVYVRSGFGPVTSDCGTVLVSGRTKLKSNSLNTQKRSKMKGMMTLTLLLN